MLSVSYNIQTMPQALASSVDGDIWTTDRDFAGTGVRRWSTPNLMRGLASAYRQSAIQE